MFFPSDQESSEAVHPGVGAFDFPAAGLCPEASFCLDLSSPVADVLLDLAAQQALTDLLGVIPAIEAQVGLHAASWHDHRGVQRLVQQEAIIAVSGCYDDRDG